MHNVNLVIVVPEYAVQPVRAHRSRQWVDNALGRTAQG